MTTDRRRFLFASAAGLAAAGSARARTVDVPADGLPPGLPGRDYRPVLTPNGATLPHKVVGGVKVFHLVVQPVTHTFAPGLVAECYGYNGRVHGPTIEAVEGDRVRIYVTNKLDTATTVHWHGLYLPCGMDGVGGLTQRSIEPGETFKYEFALRQHGTFLYHSHHDEMTQMALGLMGIFVVHPRVPSEPLPDRDFAYLLSEWSIPPGARRPDPNEMTDFNVLTLNAKIFPATDPMVVQTGQRVRIRIGNLSAMDHHPIHLHGYSFLVTDTDGGVVPPSARWPETTVLVPVGSTRTCEFVADAPGDWAMHCHMTHHVMTQMGHDIPNLTGVEPGDFDAKIAELVPETAHRPAHLPPVADDVDDSIPKNSLPMMGGAGPHGYITMGGMFTVLKVRDVVARGEDGGFVDPGWYEPPPGTLADLAAPADLAADGIEP